MTLKAHEDKTYRGAIIASLTIPWGQAINADDAARRRLPLRVGTRPVRGGHRAARRRRHGGRRPRRSTGCSTCSSSADGSFPQNSHVDGTPVSDSAAARRGRLPDRARLAARAAPTTPRGQHVQQAADFLVGRGPAHAAGALGGGGRLLALDDRRRDRRAGAPRRTSRSSNGDTRARPASTWASPTTGSATSRTGPSRPPGRSATAATTCASTTTATPTTATRWTSTTAAAHRRARGRRRRLPRARSPRRQAAADDPYVARSLPEIDATLGVTPRTAAMLAPLHPRRLRREGRRRAASTGAGIGRLWPLLQRRARRVRAGQRPRRRSRYLQTMADTANAGYMIPEQVWDRPTAARLHLRRGHRLGDAAGLVDGPVRPAAHGRSPPASPVETPASSPTATPPATRPPVPSLTDHGTRARLARRRRTATGHRHHHAAKVYGRRGRVRRHRQRRPAAPSAPRSPLPRGRNQITVVAEAADGGTNDAPGHRRLLRHARRRLHRSHRRRQRPGHVRLPDRRRVRHGRLRPHRLRRLRRRRRAFVTTIAGAIINPWGGNEISLQRLNVYVSTAQARVCAAQPGTNASSSSVFVRHRRVGFIELGIRDASGTVVATVTCWRCPRTHQISRRCRRRRSGPAWRPPATR